jgi:hypothetical protein
VLRELLERVSAGEVLREMMKPALLFGELMIIVATKDR